MNREYMFADRAKSIISRYKRSDFDPIEKKEMNDKLKELSDEQELIRQSSNIGGERLHSGGGPMEYIDPVNFGPSNRLAVNPMLINSADTTDNREQLSPYNTSIIPSIAAGGISTIGNLLLANSNKGGRKLKNPKLSAENISFAPERESYNRNYNLDSAISRGNVRSGARTRGEYLSNLASSDAAMARGRADLVGQSYQREALANAQERARIAGVNAQLTSQENQYNASLANKMADDRAQYYSAMIQGIPAMTRDILATKQQDALINSLGSDYGIYMTKNGNVVRRLRSNVNEVSRRKNRV